MKRKTFGNKTHCINENKGIAFSIKTTNTSETNKKKHERS
jgi:hypothetical protein